MSTIGSNDSLDATYPGLFARLALAFRATWDLGIVSFGGPPVHYQIFNRRFVQTKDERMRWADERTYHDLFALSQALPGPTSTKFMFCLTFNRLGFLPALLQFTLWTLPGAIGMYASALALARVPDDLPELVYACMSGLNSGTVGVVASSAMLLTEGVLKVQVDGELNDNVGVGMTRAVLIFAACMSIGHEGKDIWFFPSVMAVGALTIWVWGIYLDWKARRNLHRHSDRMTVENGIAIVVDGDDISPPVMDTFASLQVHHEIVRNEDPETGPITPPVREPGAARWIGVSLIVGFFIAFAAINIVRGLNDSPPVLYKLFSNLFLAGSIIFGGGPVVVPLLNQYVVEEGWVSARDFLLGLAIIQAFPGPNFNFSVLLAALTPTSFPTAFSGFVGFTAIFAPGMVLAAGASLLWFSSTSGTSTASSDTGADGIVTATHKSPGIRTNVHVRRVLRGVNAAAVGLVWSAVVRLWQKGYLRGSDDRNGGGKAIKLVVENHAELCPSFVLFPARGTSLGENPFWVVVAVIAFSGNRWYDLPPPVAIGLGGCLGFLWGYAAGPE